MYFYNQKILFTFYLIITFHRLRYLMFWKGKAEEKRRGLWSEGLWEFSVTWGTTNSHSCRKEQCDDPGQSCLLVVSAVLTVSFQHRLFPKSSHLRLILQTSNCLDSSVPVRLGLFQGPKLFFECQEQINAWSKCIMNIPQLSLFLLPFATHVEN